MPRPLFALLAFILIAAGTLGGGLIGYRFLTQPPATAQPAAKPVHLYQLVDAENHPVTEQNLNGHYSLVFFGFTTCPDICPTTLAALAEVMAGFAPAQRQNLQVVFISVDPQRDHPAAHPGKLKDYVAGFGPSNFTAWTGSDDELRWVAGVFKVYYARRADPAMPDGYTLDHSGEVFLTAPDGTVIARFKHGTPPAEILTRLRTVMR